MGSIYVVVDKYGFIAAYDDRNKALALVDEWKEIVELLIMEFLMDEDSQKKEVYFVPYCGLECDSRFPVAFCSNNRLKAVQLQAKLVSMELTYADDILFFTKSINVIDPKEYVRLTDRGLRVKEHLFDSLINKIEGADTETLNLPFPEMLAGLLWLPGDLLKKDSKEIVTTESD